MADIFHNPALIKRIKDLQQGIKSQKFNSEAKVRAGIVRPLLEVLGWDIHNIDQVVPEAPIKTHKSTIFADFALRNERDENKKYKVVLELKTVGKINDAVDQLFTYLLHSGAGFGIATDGREWHFYLAQTEGAGAKEKLIYRTSIEDDSPSDTASVLQASLEYRRVMKGGALEDLKKVFGYRRVGTQVRETWEKLIKGIKRDKDESKKLVNPLVSHVIRDMPQAPPRKEVQKAVEGFLESLAPPVAETEAPPKEQVTSSSKTNRKDRFKVWCNGLEIEGKNGAEKMTNLMKKLDEEAR